MIRGVIFDLDGVLVTTDELHYQAWRQVADREGIYFDRTINHQLRGVSRMESLEIILERAGRAYTPEEKSALANRKNHLYRELLRTLTAADVLPGVQALLAELRRRGIRLAVASSSKNAPLILSRVGLKDAFDAVADGNDITHSKPDPEVFLLAAERLGLLPEECLVVEDAAAGIEGGRRAGMAVFGIGTPETLPKVERLAAGLADTTAEGLLGPG
ncbi:MAG TPA: beta-phosphoglucomutase [Phycisphaerae bacterium]|nr:beta-phosphoglucomutase [Phycisphaerae bacterium]HRY68037.1 beta-phosphoglucomutase [Phycisphaerae bacterium]HSA28683.1 beta-phosphoglucomutase [Phycisphaerae bacterium]